MNYKKIEINNLDTDRLQLLCGINDDNIKFIEEETTVKLMIKNGEIFSIDADVKQHVFISNLFASLCVLIDNQEVLDRNAIKNAINNLNEHNQVDLSKIIAYKRNNQPIRAKTYGQYQLIEAIKNNDVVFAAGPAGTGKTYLAVVMAILALKNGTVKKIVLTRPAVEAGESLGFLPGDLKEKVDPYLMPLYDSLNELLGAEKVETLLEKKVIEIIPLAYMRGRTLNDSFAILDEAQNTTSQQMLMFLTRLGLNSKMVITGDMTQTDLNIHRSSSGLKEAFILLRGIKGICHINLTNCDIVRNHLVQAIIERYEKNKA